MTNLTLFIDDPATDYQCDLVFRETISKDIYLMLEELESLRNFDFWPHDYHDVEKPSSQAKEYEFIWRAPLQKSWSPHWLKNYLVKKEEQGQELLHMQIIYPFHFRYQPARFGGNMTRVSYSGPPNVYLDCNKTPLKSYSKHEPDRYPPFKNLVTTQNAPQRLSEMIPNGIKEDLRQVQIFTFGSTLLGFLLLAYAIV